MNFTPFNGQFAGSIPAAAVHQFTTAKFAQNITAANGSQMGQVVGVLSGGEGGVHYLRPVEGGGGFQQQQQLITLPITVPGAKPGDPQQTVQIQVMNPNVSGLTTQTTLQQPKYQMAQIPIQTFQQGEIGTTVLTVAYAQQDGSDSLQILGNAGLPEGIQVVAAIQPQDMQQMLAHLPSSEISGGKSSADCSGSQGIQLGALLAANPQQMANLVEEKKNALNNNNNNNVSSGFRIKQESITIDEQGNVEASPPSPQWSIAPGAELAEYLTRVSSTGQLPVSLHQFLRFNSFNSIKREMPVVSSGSGVSNQAGSEEGTEASEIAGSEDGKEANLEEMMQQTETIQEGDIPKAKKKKKYKKKPPKPKKPKPGQVVIATALDGTTLYCCPECHMAYPDKELLEQHLVGHKIERRYICGICGAGLKRREHLERHKLGHNPDRPFVCSVCMKGFKRKEHLNLHYVIHSGEKTEICQECGKGFYRKDHLRKHARSHAARRAREEQQMLQSQQNNPGQHTNQQLNQQNQQQQGQSSSVNNVNQVRINQETLGTIQPEITIHVKVPTSSIPVPVQISVPHHIVSMANSANASAAGQQALALKQGMEEMLLQQIVNARANNSEQQS